MGEWENLGWPLNASHSSIHPFPYSPILDTLHIMSPTRPTYYYVYYATPTGRGGRRARM